LLLSLMVALLALPMAARPAQAIETWCADDPIVSVNGRLLDIQVQMPVDKLLTMRSTTLTVIVPANVPAAVILDDVSAFPMRTTISRTGPAWNGSGGIPIVIEVHVVSRSDYPVRLVARPLLDLTTLLAAWTAEGTTNRTLRMPMALGR
jgi:hypothetical protein